MKWLHLNGKFTQKLKFLPLLTHRYIDGDSGDIF